MERKICSSKYFSRGFSNYSNNKILIQLFQFWLDTRVLLRYFEYFVCTLYQLLNMGEISSRISVTDEIHLRSKGWKTRNSKGRGTREGRTVDEKWLGLPPACEDRSRLCRGKEERPGEIYVISASVFFRGFCGVTWHREEKHRGVSPARAARNPTKWLWSLSKRVFHNLKSAT